MLRSARTILVAAVVILTLGACSDTTGSGNADDLDGVYTLRTIDGQLLPVIVDEQGEDIAEVTQGSVTIHPDLTFDDVTVLRITEAGVVTTETETAAGTWSLLGRTVQFTPNDGSQGPYAMAWDGENQLTQLFAGFTLVYRK